MKFPLIWMLATVVFGILSPSGVNANSILGGQGGSELEIGCSVGPEMRLHEIVGKVGGFFAYSKMKLDQGIVKGRQEFSPGLLGEKFAPGLLGNSSAKPSSAKTSGERASNTQPSCNDRVAHVMWAYVGGVAAGLLVLAIFGCIALRPRRPNV